MRDLFPETLLVRRQGEHIYTTSRKVAEHFGKNHHDVLRAIKRLLTELADIDPEDDHERNFAFVMYESIQGKGAAQMRPEYHLSHDGFALLAMGFTGREALRWKVAFLTAFRQAEADLADMQARYLAALDHIRPSLRPTVQDAQAGLPRAATAQRLGKSVGAVSYHRSRARSLGLLATRHTRPKVERDRFGFPLDAEVIGGVESAAAGALA